MPNREVAVITHAPNSPHDDRVRRMIHYSVAMGIRIVCVLALFVVPGWWKIIPAVGAALLPYYAVVIANLPKRVNSDFQSMVQRAISQDAARAHAGDARSDRDEPQIITVPSDPPAEPHSSASSHSQQTHPESPSATAPRSSATTQRHDQLALRHV